MEDVAIGSRSSDGFVQDIAGTQAARWVLWVSSGWTDILHSSTSDLLGTMK